MKCGRRDRTRCQPVLMACVCGFNTLLLAAEPPVTAIAFAPDGRSVVVGSQAGVFVDGWPELARQRAIETPLVGVHDLVFSPSGVTLAIVGGSPAETGQLQLVDWPSGQLQYVRTGHKDCITSVSWASDVILATGGLDQVVVIWNATTGEPLRRLEGHSRGVSAVSFLPAPALLVSAGLDQSLRVWRAASGHGERSMNNHTGEVHQLALRPMAEGLPMVASVSDDRTVRFWQPTLGRMVRFCQLSSIPLAVSWLRDGSFAVVACADGHVRWIDPDTAKVVQDLPVLDGWAYSLAVHPSDGSVLAGGRDGQLARVPTNAIEPGRRAAEIGPPPNAVNDFLPQKYGK